HQTFPPAAFRLDELPYRQGVEQFIADDEQRPLGQVLHALAPLRFYPRQRGFLHLRQPVARLHQRDPRLPREGRVQPLQRAQYILHQRSASGPDLRQHRAFRRTASLPGRIEPYADEFAEHLAHLRRGDEITLPPERFARRVIAVLRVEQALRHIFGHADRARRPDQLLQSFLERGHAT